MSRTALGRGLGSLIKEVEETREGLQNVAIESVDPSPFQPRRHFTEDKLKELTDSIRSSGIVQPILVRKNFDRYQIVAGERRWRAAKKAGLEKIPAVIRTLSDLECLQLALTENILREDLNQLEIARGMEAMVNQFKYNHDEIAQQLGINRSTVSNTIRLLKLPQEIQTFLREGRLTPGHARAILSTSNINFQILLANRIIKEDLSVRQVEKICKRDVNKTKTQSKENEIRTDPNIKAALMNIERKIGTKVQLSGSKTNGKLIIWYHSSEELNRLYDILLDER